MPSVQYSYAQTAAVEFEALMGGRVFENPKNWRDLARIFEYLTEPHDLVVDFFAGSASTAHAVVYLNRTTGSRRRYVLVQLPEVVPDDSVAADAGFSTLTQIARDRIERACNSLPGAGVEGEDLGFRSLRVDTTNMTDVLRVPDAIEQDQLDLQTDSVKPDRTGEDLLFQVLLDWGLELTMAISVEEIDGHEVFVVEDGALVACFDNEVSPALVRNIAEREPLRAVFRDSGFASDADRINTEQVFAEVSPSTDVKAI